MNLDRTAQKDRSVLGALRDDFKCWRKLVSECAYTSDFIPPATEEQYKVVHRRILATCRELAGQESVAVSRRHFAMRLDELLRPWASTRSFQEAQPHLVTKLVKDQMSLEEQLRGERQGFTVGQLRKVASTACVAALAGIAIFLFLEWASSDASAPVFRSGQMLLTNMAAYLEHITFTEQFAIALLFSWIFGTWLLSRLSNY